MNKAWFQDYKPLSNTEEGFLGGLQHSPVSFGAYISNDFFGYSGGIGYVDKDKARKDRSRLVLPSIFSLNFQYF